MAEKDLESSIDTKRARPVTLSVKDEQPATPSSTPNPSNTSLHCLAILCLILVLALMLLLESKSQHRQLASPFKADSFFVYMSLVALVVSELAYAILILNYNLRGSLVYTILKSVCFFSGILAPLSLVFVLCVPHNLKWVRYFSICLLYVIIVAYNFIGYARNLEDRQVMIVDEATIAREYLLKEIGN